MMAFTTPSTNRAADTVAELKRVAAEVPLIREDAGSPIIAHIGSVGAVRGGRWLKGELHPIETPQALRYMESFRD
jgi:hypothetical protein